MKELKQRFPIYSKLLMLYPKGYRQRFEDEILLTSADMLDNAGSFKAKARVWASLALDLPFNVARQNYEYIGGSMRETTPNYIKRNSLISGALLLPFFMAITANVINKLINNTNLYGSWLWHKPALILWVFYLPALAFLLSLFSYSVYVFQGSNKTKVWLKRAVDIIHSWPVLIAGVIAFAILFMVEFHDSTQCVVNSPIHAISHAGQTLHCVEANRAIIPRHDFSL